MAKLIVLGTASAVPTLEHENTHFVLKGESSHVLIDCVGNPINRLEMAEIDLAILDHIILTHCHPDHISGVPSLLMSLWLLGRKKPLHLYGLHHTLDCVEKMMDLYDWGEWPDFFPVDFHRLSEEEMTLVIENDEFRIFSSPVCHMLPTIGLRIECQASGVILAFSCDTEPCEAVIGLAKGGDILFHEATGQSFGHSSAAQAGEVAQRAGVETLFLVHYPPQLFTSQDLIKEAKTTFTGEVKVAEDFMEVVC